jgi:SAM-dependent methyltransferase
MIESRYTDGTYFASNPDWGRTEAAWKSERILEILRDHQLTPGSICEVGCGSGNVLAHLSRTLPATQMVGYDISPQAARFWCDYQETDGKLNFYLGDFHQLNKKKFDLLLICDVFEHLRDPFTFLEKSRDHSDLFVFHIPLDLSAVSVARGSPLISVREKVGHLHSYTKDLALETLRDSGYEIIEWRYTGAVMSVPNRSLKTKVASLVRKLACLINRDFGVRVFGGETLLVLAK